MNTTSITALLAALAALASACGGGSSGPCADGATRCSGAGIQTCGGGVWTTTTDCAASQQVCTASPGDGARCTAPPAPECAAGAQGCLVELRRECGADGWTDVADCALDGSTCVQLSATAAACLAQCQEDDQRCVPENAVQTCVQGAWIETDRCTVSDRLCVPTSFNAAECRRDCVEDEVRCEGNTVERCHYVWVAQQACGDAQICREPGDGTATCVDVQCDNGDTRCSGPLREKCVDRLWTTAVDCRDDVGPDGLCRRAEAGGLTCAAKECDGEGRRCLDNAVERCAAGFWTEEEACGERVCVADAGAAECKTSECEDGMTRCADEALQTCVGSFWAAPSGCGTGNGCRVGPQGAACAPKECEAGQTRCKTTTTAETCAGGFWAPLATCAGEERCLQPTGGAAGCGVACEPGEERCGALGVEKCAADQTWTPGQSCSDSCVAIACNGAEACLGGSGCVDACSGDGECASGDCLPFYGACRPPAAGAVCTTCTADAQCGLFGDACIDILAEGTAVERACATACGSSADCPRAFACDGGQCRPVDGLVTYHTCAAIRDLLTGKSCIPGLDQCGVAGVSDGTCYLGTCTIGCFGDDDCPEATHCADHTLSKFCERDSP